MPDPCYRGPMFDRFRKGKPQPEVSSGGSVIHRYDAETWSATPVGLPDESAAAFAKARDDVYRRFFGEALSVSHEVIPLLPHVDVFTFRRTGEGGRKVITL